MKEEADSLFAECDLLVSPDLFFTHVLTVIHFHSFFPVCSDTQLVVGGSEHLCPGTKQEAISGWMVFSTVFFCEVILQ